MTPSTVKVATAQAPKPRDTAGRLPDSSQVTPSSCELFREVYMPVSYRLPPESIVPLPSSATRAALVV